jgi:hypothetical protein
MLTIASLFSILFMTFHLTDDIVRGFEKGGVSNLTAVPIFVVWLYGTLVLRAVRQCPDSDFRQFRFTAHSLRHTFITDLMEKTGNDAGTVMKYSGHKTLESFSIYLHPTEHGRILATQAMEIVGDLLGGLEGCEGLKGQQVLKTESSNPLQTQEVAV